MDRQPKTNEGGAMKPIKNILLLCVTIGLISFTFLAYNQRVQTFFEKVTHVDMIAEAKKNVSFIENGLNAKCSYLESVADTLKGISQTDSQQVNNILTAQAMYNSGSALMIIHTEQLTPNLIIIGDSSQNTNVLLRAAKGQTSMDMERDPLGNTTGQILVATPIYYHENINSVLYSKYPAIAFLPEGTKNIEYITFHQRTNKPSPANIDDGIAIFNWKNEQYLQESVPMQLMNWELVISVPKTTIAEQYLEISGIGIRFTIQVVVILTGALLVLMWKEKKCNQEILRTKQKLEALTANVPGGIFTHSADGFATFDFISEGLLKLFGYTEHEFRSITNNSFYNMMIEADREKTAQQIKYMDETGTKTPIEYRVRDKEGNIHWLNDSAQCIVDDKGKEWIYVVVIDTTKQHMEAEARLVNEAKYRMIVEKSDNIIYEWHFEDNSVVMSDVWEKKLGYQLPNQNFFEHSIVHECIHPEDATKMEKMLRNIRAGNAYEEVIVRFKKLPENTYIWMKTCFMCVYNTSQEPSWGMGISIDIDGQVRQAQNFKLMAEFDSLTGLYNRRITEEKIKESIQSSTIENHAFIVLDVDNFKEINDGQGHIFGDKMLKNIGEVLQKGFESKDILGRLGGDEFVLFIISISSTEALRQKLAEICRRIYEHSEKELSVSMGVAIFPEDGKDYKSLYAAADKALYYAKGEGKNTFCMYQDIDF